MFNDEIYVKARIVLEEIDRLDEGNQTQNEGCFHLTIKVVSELRLNLNEIVDIKSKKEKQLEEENSFFDSKGYTLIRNLGLMIYLFNKVDPLKTACFELLKVFKSFSVNTN